MIENLRYKQLANGEYELGIFMKFNPITKCLFTDDNTLIKKLHCPYDIVWNNLTSVGNQRSCSICNKSIVDTQNLADDDVLNAVREDARVCLKVDINSSNIRVVNHNV